MKVTAKTIKALCIMYTIHRNQKDKADAPYWLHPLRVGSSMEDEGMTAVALLHDVVEDYGKAMPQWNGFAEFLHQLFWADFFLALQVALFLTINGSPISTKDLKKIASAEDKNTFFKKVCKEVALLPEEEEALCLLTRDKSVLYDEYIEKISTSVIATKVKLADLKDNCNLSRLSEEMRCQEDTQKRQKKYEKAAERLEQSLLARKGKPGPKLIKKM